MNEIIRQTVNRLVRKYQTHNPFEIAKALNIEIQVGSPGCDGCYMFLKNHRYIFLNCELSEAERKLVMAHELGHAIFHRKQNCYDNALARKIEKYEKYQQAQTKNALPM